MVLAEPVSPLLGKNEALAAPILAFAGWQHVLRRKGRSIFNTRRQHGKRLKNALDYVFLCVLR